MALIFEFEAGKSFHFVETFARRFGAVAKDDMVVLPPKMGEGYIQEVYLNNGLSLCIHNYTLGQELLLKRLESDHLARLTIKFDCIANRCEAEIGTSNFFSEMAVSTGEPTLFLVMTASRKVLTDLLKLDKGQLLDLLNNNPSFLFYERMTPTMQHALGQIAIIGQQSRLHELLYQSRALELLYLLFDRIISRSEKSFKSINKLDVETIFKIRDRILANLDVAPQLPGLAKEAGMSLSKLKYVFHQVFGISIYSFYQSAKMDHAAELLQTHSVSETGYQLGYTNLSYFTRLFEKHHKLKPKKFKDNLPILAGNITFQ